MRTAPRSRRTETRTYPVNAAEHRRLPANETVANVTRLTVLSRCAGNEALGWRGSSLVRPLRERRKMSTAIFARREKRQAPRVDVYQRVHGVLVSLNTPIEIRDLSLTGFAVVSEAAFEPGQKLDFRISGPYEQVFRVTAQAVRTTAVPDRPGAHVTGFTFTASGSVLGLIPTVAIERLMEAVNPEAVLQY